MRNSITGSLQDNDTPALRLVLYGFDDRGRWWLKPPLQSIVINQPYKPVTIIRSSPLFYVAFTLLRICLRQAEPWI